MPLFTTMNSGSFTKYRREQWKSSHLLLKLLQMKPHPREPMSPPQPGLNHTLESLSAARSTATYPPHETAKQEMIPASVVIGATILLHTAYSTYEWVHAHKLLGSASHTRVPKDIIVEALFGLAVILLSTISRAVSQMKPIKVNELNVTKTVAEEHPYAYLEARPNFQDIVSKRKEYLDWKLKQASETQTN